MGTQEYACIGKSLTFLRHTDKRESLETNKVGNGWRIREDRRIL